jgi:NAD(P)-dependent dehydrogenase (short-subunit alcohol dehydrogenase family)
MNCEVAQKHYPKCVLITGSTDGIGLLTAKMFCRHTPHDLTLALHGRDPERLKRAEEAVRLELSARKMNYNNNNSSSSPNHIPEVSLVSFCYDLSSTHAVREFAREVESRLPSLDCLINNAAVFDKGGPHTTIDGYELSFQVNVLAPFVLTILLACAMKGSLRRILNTSSMSHTDSKHHLDRLDYTVWKELLLFGFVLVFFVCFFIVFFLRFLCYLSHCLESATRERL